MDRQPKTQQEKIWLQREEFRGEEKLGLLQYHCTAGLQCVK